MSNRLINQAQKLRQIIPIGARGVAQSARDLHPSEMAVLLALANDARDVDGDMTKLRTVKIMARTRLSEPAVRKAYRQLQANGHITRIRGAEGEPSVTRVHPKLTPFTTTAAAAWDANTGVSSVPVTHVVNTGNPCIEDMGLIENKIQPIDHSPPASAREVSISSRKEADEPVDQVFDAWDAWRDRAGLPGPVTRTAARAVAVDKAVRANGLGKVLMMIDTIEREVRAGNFRRKNHEGQDNIWATFDAAFEIGHAASLNLLTRLLDGDFGALAVREPQNATSSADRPEDRPDNALPEPERRLRAALRELLGEKASAVWIDPLRFEFTGDGVRAVAPSAFHADYLMTSLAAQLRRAAADAGAGGIVVRIRERERA